MNININQSATVILTNSGAEYLTEYEKQFTYRLPKEYKEGDVYRSQLWSLIQTFGGAIHMGFEVPFKDCEIDVEPFK